MGTFIRIALRNLLQARRRTALLSVAIATVTLLLVILMALSAGIRDNMVRNAMTITTGHVNVSGFYKTSQSDAAPIVVDVDALRTVVEENVEGVETVVQRMNGFGRLVSTGDVIQGVFKGIDIEEEERFLDVVQLAPERDYIEGGGDATPGDLLAMSKPGSIMLFANQAERLKVGVGDVLTIKAQTFTGATNTAEVTVVAVAKDVGLLSNFFIFVHPQSLLDVYQLKGDTSGTIMVYLDDMERADDVQASLRVALEQAGYTLMDYDPRPFFMKFEGVRGEDWTGQKLDLTTWEDETEMMSWVLAAVDGITYILISVLTIIIIIGIMNTMWIAVRERTREVGTMRAIGMSKRGILMLFMTEALIMGLGATLLGGVLGSLLAIGLDAAAIGVPVDAMEVILMSDTVHFSVHLAPVVKAIALFTAITALAALAPAWRASRLQPVTAISQIE